LSNLFKAVAVALALTASASAQTKSPGAGPILVLETAKGTIEIETYPEEAPKTVARIVELTKKNFYNGLRFHRTDANFLVQVGDPVSRDVSRESWWGRQGSGKPIGVAEITRKRLHARGAVAMAHPGVPGQADSQMYVTLADRPDLNGKYTVFGQVTSGADVPPRLERGDVIRKMSVKE
jgi:cyclophilin family peptidyl-prolyl cis-trans isomerase